MTYLPPVNGGRINASIGGNTAGAGALISSGTLSLMGGNNITLSQNANSITISGGAGGGGNNTFGMSNLGNSSGTSGMASGSAVQFAFAGGNNVTLSQSLNASSGTITISAANQTVQTQNLHNLTLAGNSTSAGAGYIQVSSGTLTLAGGNNITLSQNGNAVTISGGAGGGGVAIANSQATYTNSTVNMLEGGGAITIATSAGGQSLKFSVPQTSSLSATGAVSISTNGSTISVGAPTQTNQTLGMYAVSNTTQNSSTTLDARTLSFQGAGGASVGYSNGSVVVSSPIGINLSAGTTSNNLASVVFSNSNGINFGLNGSTVTASQTASTLSRFEYPEGLFTALSSIGQGSLSINHMYIPFYVSGSAAKIGGQMTVSTSSAAATGSANFSLWMGIYTLNGSNLSLASSGSALNAFSWQAASSATSNLTGVTGMRQMTVPMNVNITPGEYWMGAVISSATTATSAAFTIYGNAQVISNSSSAVLAPIGSNITAARDVMLLQGIYTSNTSAGPASIPGASINNLAAGNVLRANFYNAIFNATY